MENKPGRKSKSVDALKKTEHDPHVSEKIKRDFGLKFRHGFMAFLRIIPFQAEFPQNYMGLLLGVSHCYAFCQLIFSKINYSLD